MVAGGYEGGESYHQSAEIYDAHANIWMAIAPMSCKRSGFGLITSEMGGGVYAVGGSCDGTVGTDVVEMYDERVGRWEILSGKLICKRGYSGACGGSNGKLYTACGVHNNSFVSSIEWMDPRMNIWQQSVDAFFGTDTLGMLERSDAPLVYLMD